MKSLIIAIFTTVLVAAPAWADHGKKHGDHERARAYYFQPYDVRVIRPYAPVYQSLPPGLAKKYYRTGHLPPGWQKKIQPFPVVLERQLVRLPPPYHRGFIDGYAVVYNPRTQVIIDVAMLR